MITEVSERRRRVKKNETQVKTEDRVLSVRFTIMDFRVSLLASHCRFCRC